MHSFGKSGKVQKVKAQKRQSLPSKGYKKPDLSAKHIGYKSNKKRMTNSVGSKLNYDTASYRAKFEGKGKESSTRVTGMRKGVAVATMNDLTKNGFQTSLKPKQSVGPKRVNSVPKTKSNYEKFCFPFLSSQILFAIKTKNV